MKKQIVSLFTLSIVTLSFSAQLNGMMRASSRLIPTLARMTQTQRVTPMTSAFRCYASKTDEERETMNKTAINPRNTVILFDIHGVILKADYKQFFKRIWHAQGKLGLIFNLLKPKAFIVMLQMLAKHSTPERYIMKLASENPQLKEYVPLCIELCNAQKPIPVTCSLIEQLKERGYTLHILSNIGEQTYEQLQSRFPDIFNQFDAARVASTKDGYISKPSKEAFNDYLKNYNPTKKTVLFIDNNKINIRVAQSLGMKTILCKSAQKLKDDLILLKAL